MTTKRDVVYILREKDAAHIKIGISRNIRGRISSLPETIDIKNSYYIESLRPVRRIEQLLHIWFDDYHLNKPPAQGHTEWFDVACLDGLQRFVEEHRDRLRLSELRPLEELIPARIKAIPPAPMPVSHRPNREERWQQHLVHAAQANERAEKLLNCAIQDIRDRCLGRICLKHPGAKPAAYFVFPKMPDDKWEPWNSDNPLAISLILFNDAKTDSCFAYVFDGSQHFSTPTAICRELKPSIAPTEHPLVAQLWQTLENVPELPSGLLRDEVIHTPVNIASTFHIFSRIGWNLLS